MKINGHLEFHTLGDGELKNAIIERLAGGSGGTSLPDTSQALGRIAYNTDDNTYYYVSSLTPVTWTPFSSGGGTAALQTEVDNIEAASGGIFDTDGTYGGSPVDSALSNVSGSTSLLDALTQLDSAINTATGVNTLNELTDTTISNGGAPVATSFLRWTAGSPGTWADHVLATSDITDVTASATELNVLDGIPVDLTPTEIGYLDGVTSSIQDQFTAVDTEAGYLRTFMGKTGAGSESPTYSSTNYVTQGVNLEVAIGELDADLGTAIAAIDLGALADVTDAQAGSLTSADSYFFRGDSGSPVEYEVIEGTLGALNNVASGVDGTPTDNVLGFNGSQWTAITVPTMLDDGSLGDLGDVTITAAADNNILQYAAGSPGGWVNITPSALAGDMALGDLSDVTDSANANYVLYKDTASTWAAAATGSTSGVQGQGDVLDDLNILGAATVADKYIYSTGAGVFIYGDITSAGRALLDDADAATQRATLSVYSQSEADSNFVDASGDTMAGNLVVPTSYNIQIADAPSSGTHAVNKTYVDNLVAGLTWKNSAVAATTANITLSGTQTIDDIALSAGDRVLVKDQSTGADNGIYVVAAGAWSRATDMDETTPVDEVNGAAVYVEQGTANGDTGWTMTSQVTGSPTGLGTDTITWTQFTGASSVAAGVGLGKTGNTLFVNMGAGIVQLPSDEVGLDIATGVAVQLTSTGSPAEDKLTLVLDGSTLSQSGTGLKVADGGITGVQLASSVAGEGLALNTVGSPAVDQLDVNVDGSTIEISSDTLQVADGGITNAKLADATITIQDDAAATDAISLSETLTVAGTDPINTAIAANVLTISVTAATTAALGVASFATADFSVAAGAVSIKALGVSNAQLVNDNITVSGDGGAGDIDVDLGGTALTIAGGSGCTTVESANTITVNVDDLSSDELTDVTAAPTASGQVNVAVESGSPAEYNYTPTHISHVHTQSSSSTTWTVTHSLGQKFVNVTVYDSSDQVIIPQSVTATSTTVTTITFNTAITGTVVVMGVAGSKTATV